VDIGRPVTTTAEETSELRWVVAIAVAACVALLMLYRGFAGDDAYIHLQYARHLASGRGFAFNVGEPSYGSTSPLWIMLIAGVGRLFGGHFLLASKLLSLVFTVLSVLLFHRLARRVLPFPALAEVATFGFILDPWLLKWGGSGMETSLSVVVVLGATLLHLRERDRGGVPWASLALGVGTLVRPELVGLFLITQVDRMVCARKGARELPVALALYLAPVLPWIVFSFKTFGDPVAMTIHAKSGSQSVVITAVRMIEVLGVTYWPALLAITLGGVVGFRRVGRSRARSWLGKNTVIWGWALGLPLAYVLTRSHVASRHLLLAAPYLVLLGFGAVGEIGSRRGRLRSGVVLLVLSAAVSGTIQAAIIYPRTRFTRGVDDRLIGVGEWLRDHTPPDALVAAHEVGAVGYYGERRILDTAGLVTPRALPYVRDYRIADLLRKERADYYVSSGYWPTDRQVLAPLGKVMTKLYETRVQRGGSSPVFSKPMSVAVYRFAWPEEDPSPRN
jgi:arabinofuranosyltransferase